jgi:hypothetical protein
VGETVPLGPEQRRLLEIVAAGIPHLANVVSAVPPDFQAPAFQAAESGYFQTMRQLGLSDGESRIFTDSLMRRLRRRVADKAENEALKKLYVELTATEAGAVQLSCQPAYRS